VEGQQPVQASVRACGKYNIGHAQRPARRVANSIEACLNTAPSAQARSGTGFAPAEHSFTSITLRSSSRSRRCRLGSIRERAGDQPVRAPGQRPASHRNRPLRTDRKHHSNPRATGQEPGNFLGRILKISVHNHGGIPLRNRGRANSGLIGPKFRAREIRASGNRLWIGPATDSTCGPLGRQSTQITS